jgi:hypothetical protein
MEFSGGNWGGRGWHTNRQQFRGDLGLHFVEEERGLLVQGKGAPRSHHKRVGGGRREWHGRRRKEKGRKRGSHIGTVEKRPWEGHPETHPFLVAAQPNRLLRTATAATGIGSREGAQDNNDLLPYPKTF